MDASHVAAPLHQARQAKISGLFIVKVRLGRLTGLADAADDFNCATHLARASIVATGPTHLPRSSLDVAEY